MAAWLAVAGAQQNASAYSLLRLQAPWPSGVGRLSRAAARAINEEPHASTVEFAASPVERRRLEEGGAAPTLVHAGTGGILQLVHKLTPLDVLSMWKN